MHAAVARSAQKQSLCCCGRTEIRIYTKIATSIWATSDKSVIRYTYTACRSNAVRVGAAGLAVSRIYADIGSFRNALEAKACATTSIQRITSAHHGTFIWVPGVMLETTILLSGHND